MSFHLSSLLSGQTKQSANASQSVPVSKNTEGVSSVNPSRIMKIANGSQIMGEVVSVNGKDIVIQLGPEEQLAARLSADLNVELGQLMTFEVQKAARGAVTLRALYANLDVNPTALKALDMANIPVRENTVAMVDSMMKEGMSIDSASLQKMYHEIAKNPEAAGNTIVQLARLGMPVTGENIAQYEAYTNLNHQITGAVGEIADNISLAAQTLFEAGSVQEAFAFQSAVLDLFAGSDVSWLAETVNEGAEEKTNAAEGTVKEMSKKEAEQVRKEAAGAVSKNEAAAAQAERTDSHKEAFKDILSGKELDSLLSMSGKLGITKEVMKGMQAGTVSPKQFLSLMNQITGQMDEKAPHTERTALRQLLSSPAYGKVLEYQMKEELSLKADDMLSKEKVTELYDKLQSKMAALSSQAAELGKSAEPLAQSVNNLQQNLDFMQQLNHMASYVQLPLKLNGQNTNGELYVYTNKKNLARKDGSVSAFLHLDMTHLGSVDVYVAMQNGNHVNTHFYLQDDAMIDFISENIHILDERLEARGYNMKADVTYRDKNEPFNVLEEAKKEQSGDGSVSRQIASYAFDVRA